MPLTTYWRYSLPESGRTIASFGVSGSSLTGGANSATSFSPMEIFLRLTFRYQTGLVERFCSPSVTSPFSGTSRGIQKMLRHFVHC